MSAMKYFVPALAVAGRAAAQSASAGCSVQATTTIQNAADASALASCATFEGSIAIATGTTENINFDGIQRIEGSLMAENSTLSQISGGDLETITDTFGLDELTSLTSLNFPRLTNVDTIDWVSLPNLQGLSFTTGVQQASSVSIQNTQLNSLEGINLEVVDTLYIANNPYLSNIQMQLGNITNSLVIEANAQQAAGNTNGTIVELTNLEWAFNMTFRNVSTVLIPSLRSLNGSMGFYGNSMESISAENLTEVGGTLSFVENAALTNITMPNLQIVEGGFLIANNTDLEEVSFPALETIGGALDFNGPFTEIEMPELTRVAGAFNIQSSEEIVEICDTFEPLAGSANVIRGEFSCAGERAQPSGAGSLPDGTSSGSDGDSASNGGSGGDGSSSGDNENGANTVYISGTTGLLGVVAAVFGIL